MVKKISIFAAVLLVVGITGVGFTFKSQFKEAEILEEETVEAAEFNNIDLEANNAEVIMESTDEDHATVEFYGNNHDYTFTVDTDDDQTLTINQKSNQKLKIFDFDFFSKKTIHVYVPEKIYENIQITSDNAVVKASELQLDEMTVKTNNGVIDLNDLDTTVVFAETNNGIVKLKNVDANTVHVDSHNGVVNLDHVSGDVAGETHNGMIKLKTTDLDRSVELRARNGKIDVISDRKPTNATLDLQTGNGSITYFGEKNWDTVIGDGDHIIKLTTENGKITIK